MNIKKILEELNVLKQCRKYGVPIWQCPQFLFLVMGGVIILSALSSYSIGRKYIDDPGIVTLITLFLSMVLFIIAFTVTQSFEKLAEANRMKSEFISIVSHQLRAPLSNLKWTTEILMSGRVGRMEGSQLEYLKILKENGARMGELIANLLTVSRIQQGTLPLRKKETSFEELVRELVEDFAPFARASNIKIEISSSGELPRVFIDPSQIKLVIENLLDNAIRYTNPINHQTGEGVKRKGEIKISLEYRKDNIYFEIKDNGVGIPQNDQRYIFQKFFRSENALRYQTQGSGLGLYIAKAVVERSGGKIGFHSVEDKGTKFWFTLPIK